MFSKKFNLNGKSIQKVLPVAPPTDTQSEIVSTGLSVRSAHLDFIGIEEFLVTLREGDDKLLQDATNNLFGQLKESRALLSLASYLSSDGGVLNVLERLMDTAYFILNAENVYLLRADSKSTDFTISNSHMEDAIGFRASRTEVLEGNDSTKQFLCYFLTIVTHTT